MQDSIATETAAGPSGEHPAGSRARATVEARLALLDARFGATFGGGLAVARKAIEDAVARDERLRKVPLGNADEPVGPFVPYRLDGREEHR